MRSHGLTHVNAPRLNSSHINIPRRDETLSRPWSTCPQTVIHQSDNRLIVTDRESNPQPRDRKYDTLPLHHQANNKLARIHFAPLGLLFIGGEGRLRCRRISSTITYCAEFPWRRSRRLQCRNRRRKTVAPLPSENM